MIHHLAELSFTQVDALDRDRTVVLFAVSPLEEHGPHLPIGTDLFHAEYFNEELAKRIIEAKPGWTVLIGPSLPIGASAFDHAGTLLARARTVRNAALDYGAALARHGFRYILVTNGHAGPRHVVALEEGAAVVSRRYGVRILLGLLERDSDAVYNSSVLFSPTGVIEGKYHKVHLAVGGSIWHLGACHRSRQPRAARSTASGPSQPALQVGCLAPATSLAEPRLTAPPTPLCYRCLRL